MAEAYRSEEVEAAAVALGISDEIDQAVAVVTEKILVRSRETLRLVNVLVVPQEEN
jgi:hypothetical protein